jgi:hypothetical protein
MKSILLGSAAGIVAVAGAQAADLPTKKAAPAEYVRICNVGGMAGFIIPGSDTCLKISGYVTAQVEGGNATTGYGRTYATGPAVAGGAPGLATNNLAGSAANLRPEFGYTTRANIDFDTRTNTAYGVLRGYAEIQFENGNGFDTTGAGAYINLAYVQWAGLTAGKAPSFFSFFGGGEGWANIFSPDQQGFNQPDLLAYTATFGGGFSATIAAQSAGPNSQNFGAGAFPAAGTAGFPGGNNGASGGGTDLAVNTTSYGMTAPDVVGNLRVDQSWGSAQVSGVLHQVHAFAGTANTTDVFGNSASVNKWGWGIDGGLSFNVPQIGAGDKFAIQGVYTQNALWYSGIPDGMWGENGAVNGNGLAMAVGDSYYAVGNAAGNAAGIGAPTTSSFATPTAWSIGATYEHHFSPVFSVDPEASYAELHWSNSLGNLSTNSTSWIIGAAAHWDPVPQLDFEFELLYQSTHQSTPGVWFAPGGAMVGTTTSPTGVATVGFKNNTDGFAGRFEVTRSF